MNGMPDDIHLFTGMRPACCLADLVLINYIMKQKEHHCRKTFKEDYKGFLKKIEIEFEEKYLFELINY